MSRVTGIAVVGGGGGIGRGSHLPAILRVPGAKLVAVVDVNEAGLAEVAAQYDVATYTELDRALEREDVDVVDICTPDDLHARHAIAAARAGKHVLCEKPMEATLDAAAAMVKAAHETGKTLMIALKLRFSPQLMTAKRIVDEGTLGDIYYAECVADRRRGNPGRTFIKRDASDTAYLTNVSNVPHKAIAGPILTV